MSMKRRQRQAVILALGDALLEHGSWCGETHLQKASYFLEELTEVSLGLDFILYKHGPFSFELRDEITAMRADGLLEMRDQPYPYGPTLLTTKNGRKLMERWPKTLTEYRKRIQFVARKLGAVGVAELERVATALYVRKSYAEEDASKSARRINELKPHFSIEEVAGAVRTVDRMIQEYKGIDQ